MSDEPSTPSSEPNEPETEAADSSVAEETPVAVSQPETEAADSSVAEETPVAVSQPETRPFAPMNLVTASMAMLGRKGTDKVTGAKGVVSSISFDLYGCVVCHLAPPATEKDAYTRSFDVQRITLSDEPAVMTPPDYFAMPIPPEHYMHGGIDHDHDDVRRDDRVDPERDREASRW